MVAQYPYWWAPTCIETGFGSKRQSLVVALESLWARFRSALPQGWYREHWQGLGPACLQGCHHPRVEWADHSVSTRSSSGVTWTLRGSVVGGTASESQLGGSTGRWQDENVHLSHFWLKLRGFWNRWRRWWCVSGLSCRLHSHLWRAFFFFDP